MDDFLVNEPRLVNYRRPNFSTSTLPFPIFFSSGAHPDKLSSPIKTLPREHSKRRVQFSIREFRTRS